MIEHTIKPIPDKTNTTTQHTIKTRTIEINKFTLQKIKTNKNILPLPILTTIITILIRIDF